MDVGDQEPTALTSDDQQPAEQEGGVTSAPPIPLMRRAVVHMLIMLALFGMTVGVLFACATSPGSGAQFATLLGSPR